MDRDEFRTLSLINESDKSWIQDCIGTVEHADEVARRTEEVNSNKIKVLVCEKINSVTPRLDGPQVYELARRA